MCVTDGSVAQLTIPGALNRTRVFDVDVQLWAQIPAAGRPPELGLTLEIDGAQQWSRLIPASNPGQTDSLEYHCQLVLEPGRDTRLRARARTNHCRLKELNLEAVERSSG